MEELLLPCLFKWVTGADCPGCGFQRSVLLLASGQVKASLEMYWATIPILALFGFTLAHLKFNFHNGGKMLVIFYIVISILIFCNYFYKLSHH